MIKDGETNNQEVEDNKDQVEQPETEEKTEAQPEQPNLSAAAAIVQAAMDGNAVGVKDLFTAAVSDRVEALVANRKSEIADTLITPDQEQAETPDENPQEPEDNASETDNNEENPQDNEDEKQ